MKKIRYFIEGLFLSVIFITARCLPPAHASTLGGFLGRLIGPWLKSHHTAYNNITRAMPNLSETSRKKALIDMWDNLGRVLFEYPHLERLAKDNTSIEGTEVFDHVFEDSGYGIFIGGHLANWEMLCTTTLVRLGKQIDITYRAPNNPWSEKLLQKARTLDGRLTAHPKSRDSGRDILKSLRDKRSLGILIDQKYNEGVNVPFFDMEAMTNPIAISLAQRFKVPLVPVQCIRTDGENFKIIIHSPLNIFYDSGAPKLVDDILQEIHRMLESWIVQNPEQWLWLHRRWKN